MPKIYQLTSPLKRAKHFFFVLPYENIVQWVPLQKFTINFNLSKKSFVIAKYLQYRYAAVSKNDPIQQIMTCL